MRRNTILTSLVAGSLVFTLAACGAKPAEENVASDEVAAEQTEVAEEAQTTTLSESEAVGVAFSTLGIDQAEGVVIYPNPNTAAWDVTVTVNGDAHYFQIANDSGQILKQEAVQCASFATDGATAEEIAVATNGGEGTANDYQAVYTEQFGWGWQVTVAGPNSLKHFHVSPEGVCNLMNEVTA